MIQILATVIFGCALVHTFVAPKIGQLRHRFRKNSPGENICHLLSEVEIIFGLWAGVLFAIWSILGLMGIQGPSGESAVQYVESVHFTEAIFVFVIMTLSSATPLQQIASRCILAISRKLFLSPGRNLALVILILGPLLGSFITEPAAMTVCCFLLLPILTSPEIRSFNKYLILGLLLVNVSIGGTLTNFAAPPVLVVAEKWGWSTGFMMSHFGWRSVAAVILSTALVTTYIRRDLDRVEIRTTDVSSSPLWVVLLDLTFLSLAVWAAHYSVLLVGIFLFYLGWATVTNEFRDEVQLKNSLLVGFFLAGLVTLGGLQAWWIQPLLSGLQSVPLYIGATALTAVTDNALLTYLGTLVPDFSEGQKYSLVAGAVTGGGLTVIANAPNPIAFSILREAFGEEGIQAGKLFFAALFPTAVAALFFLV